MLFDWLIQFGPITLFFVMFQLTEKNFFIATAALMVATFFAVMTELKGRKKLALFPIFSASFIFFFGGATLLLHDPQFLIMKDTLYDGIFSGALFLSLYYRRNLMEMFFGSLFAMSEEGWRILAFRWAYFFLASSILNEIIRHIVTADIWVQYKILNTLGLLIFGIYQFTLTRRERLPEISNSLGMRIRKL